MERRPCKCNVGCPGTTQAVFTPGHDAVYRERMLGLLRTKLLSLDEVRTLVVDGLDMPGLFRQIEDKHRIGSPR